MRSAPGLTVKQTETVWEEVPAGAVLGLNPGKMGEALGIKLGRGFWFANMNWETAVRRVVEVEPSLRAIKRGIGIPG
jgi:hypothetical protein